MKPEKNFSKAKRHKKEKLAHNKSTTSQRGGLQNGILINASYQTQGIFFSLFHLSHASIL